MCAMTNIRPRDIPKYEIAAQLIALGARSTIVGSSTGVSIAHIHALSKEITGRIPVAGHLPTSTKFYLSPALNNYHSSVFLSIYEYYLNVSGLGEDVSLPKCLIDSFIYFRSLVPQSPININRAWFLTRIINSNELIKTTCKDCCSIFLSEPYLVEKKQCPACELRKSFYCTNCGHKYPELRSTNTICKSCRQKQRLMQRKKKSMSMSYTCSVYHPRER